MIDLAAFITVLRLYLVCNSLVLQTKYKTALYFMHFLVILPAPIVACRVEAA